MHTCDALIIGGGPAGSTCAAHLRRAGLDVLVLDKREFPRDKTCAGWITPAVVDELGLDIAEYSASRTIQPITGFRTGLIGARTVSTGYDRPVSYGIRRCEFDDYLLRRSGARLMLGERVESIERSGPGWVVNGSISSPLLIGAGGHFCPVARMLGPPAAKELVVAAQEIEFQMDERQARECSVSASVPELYFCPDLKGYGWCFRKGRHLNVGLGREDSVRLADHAAAFCALMKSQGRIPADTPTKLHGHAYILYGHSPRPLAEEGLLLVGDAAGLAYAESGEGIRPAIESGLFAAQTVLDARGDYSAPALRAYNDKIIARFGDRTAPPQSAPAIAAVKEWAAAFLLSTRWFSRRVLLEHWFLHIQQPALVAR